MTFAPSAGGLANAEDYDDGEDHLPEGPLRSPLYSEAAVASAAIGAWVADESPSMVTVLSLDDEDTYPVIYQNELSRR